ncbi:MAG: pyrroloquinoline quinone biosynthesis protein PqqB [Tateyamaria sp.]|uniref:pyrroloquinoline quinone biosynthesis protein PqqB n=1 Tax=Tateyamaria sp. TaxID=1929288 RepID=UPI003287F2EF
MTFRAHILGAAAGGGLPQWNCGCENCNLARAGEIPAQSQSSVAFSADGGQWAIVNASPDIRDQVARTTALHPTDLRKSPLKSILLTNGDIDHVAGLLTLREQQTFTLFATPEIHQVIADNPIFNALNPDFVTRIAIKLDEPFQLATGITARLIAVPGKVPLYLEGETVQTDLIGEQTVGVQLEASGKRVFYIPGCAAMPPNLKARIEGADMVMFDGTLWQDDEMVRAGLSQKTGQRMGHMSMSGTEGSIAAFEGVNVDQKIFVHMNNTNPVLRPGSSEKNQAEQAGWIVAQDGMEFEI